MNELIYPYNSYVITLNLRNFQEINKYIDKPYDSNIIKIFCMCSNDIYHKYKPDIMFIGFYQITLIYNNKCSLEKYEELGKNHSISVLNHLYEGNISKIISLISSYCSVRFNNHAKKISSQIEPIDDIKANLKITLDDSDFIFSAELNYFIDSNDFTNYIQTIVSMSQKSYLKEYAKQYLGNKYENIKNISIADIINMLNFVGIDWNNDVPKYITYGICSKKNSDGILDFRIPEIKTEEFTPDFLLNKIWNNDYDNDFEKFIFL
jgi:hypothetical protein